jgi:hypothetical protein
VKCLTTTRAGVAAITSAFGAGVGLVAVAGVPLGLVVISVRGKLALFAIGSNASTIPVGYALPPRHSGLWWTLYRSSLGLGLLFGVEVERVCSSPRIVVI